MTGKIRVSIVATALDGHIAENKTVLNMFSRIQNRNTGYSENLFSQNSRVENSTFNSVDGANALKLDESYELKEESEKNSLKNIEKIIENENSVNISSFNEKTSSNFPTGVSIESASYIENNKLEDNEISSEMSVDNEEEHMPRLFAEDQSYQSDEEFEKNKAELGETKELFDQDINEDEDFEIPAFLRKQKF